MDTTKNLFEQHGLLSVRQAAEKLGVSRSKIYELAKNGELKVYRIFAKKGLIKESDLVGFIENRLQTA